MRAYEVITEICCLRANCFPAVPSHGIASRWMHAHLTFRILTLTTREKEGETEKRENKNDIAERGEREREREREKKRKSSGEGVCLSFRMITMPYTGNRPSCKTTRMHKESITHNVILVLYYTIELNVTFFFQISAIFQMCNKTQVLFCYNFRELTTYLYTWNLIDLKNSNLHTYPFYPCIWMCVHVSASD